MTRLSAFLSRAKAGGEPVVIGVSAVAAAEAVMVLLLAFKVVDETQAAAIGAALLVLIPWIGALVRSRVTPWPGDSA